jgi:putative MFS transporter
MATSQPAPPAGSSSPQPSAGSDPSAIAARIDRIPTGRFHIKLASMVGVGTFFDGFDAISLAVVLPLVVTTFGIGFGQAGLIISAGYAGQFVGALLIGMLSDRIGRSKAFIVSIAVFGVLSVLCALAWTADSLMIFRLLQGIGLGAEVPIAATLVNEYLGRHSRGRFSVLYQALFTWGLFFAPLVALILTSTTSPENTWRILLGIGALPLVVAVVAWFALPESARWLAEKGRFADAEAHVRRMEQEAVEAGHTLESPVASPAPAQPRKTRLSELFQGTYGARTAMLSCVWFCTFFVTYGFTVWLPSMYVSVGGLPPSRSLMLTVLLGAVQLAMSYVVASFVDKIGRRRTFLTGFAIAILGAAFGAVNLLVLHNTSWPVLFATGIILTIGIMLPTVSLYLYTTELYPTRMRGFASSTTSSFSRIASIVSPLVFGFLLGGHGGAGAVFTILGVIAVVGLLIMAKWGPETRLRTLEETSG